MKFEEGVIWRYNGYRSVIVQSLLEEGVLNFDVVKALKPQIDELRDSLPSGYRVEVFGEVDISREVDTQLAKTMPFMLIAILTLLMFELNSIKKMYNYEEYGATPILGIKGLVLKSHGSSSKLSIKNALKTAEKLHKFNLINKFEEISL